MSSQALVELFDDDVSTYSLEQWRARNLTLHHLLVERRLIDPALVPFEAHRLLTDTLIQVRVGAASDPQNAGHVRAQNENVLYYAVAARVPAAVLTIALEAGFIHDLNKALGEPLRGDAFAVRDARGRPLRAMTTMAQIVGLNHLGERTRRALAAATRLGLGALAPEVAEAIDRCIVHHGLGSSRFICDLVNGENPWWGAEFIDPENGARRLFLPEQPPLTLASVIHDLADSTQQMQGGAAWLMKYPSGFWRASGRSYADMMSTSGATDGGIPMSLAEQITVETATCLEIVARGRAAGVLDAATAGRLERAVEETARSTRDWIDASPEALASADGCSVYHDVGRALGTSAEAAWARLSVTVPGSSDVDEVEDVIWASGQRLEQQRARELAEHLEDAETSA